MAEPLRVLLPTDVFPPGCGGAGWSAHALATALQARGHHVTAIVPYAAPAPLLGLRRGMRRAASTVEYVDGIRTVRLPYNVPRVPVVANWYRHEWLWPLLRNVVVQEALRVPAHVQVDLHGARLVIHAQHVQSVPAAVLAGREVEAPVVATVRDHWPRDYFATGLHGDRVPYRTNSWAGLLTDLVVRQGVLKGLLAGPAIPYMLAHLRRRQQFLAHADAVVAVSTYVAGLLPEVVPRDRIHVVPNLVDVEAIERSRSPEKPLPVDRPFLLFVGKLERNKGVLLLPDVLRSAREASGGNPLPRLVVAGTGPRRAELEAGLEAAGVDYQILPGWTEHDLVLRLMRRAEVLIFPSAWGDPLTRVLLEASAAGACIAAIATGGTPEIVEDGVNGLLRRDAASLGRAVAGLLADEAWRERLRAGAQRVARERWAPDVVAAKMEQLYEQVLAR